MFILTCVKCQYLCAIQINRTSSSFDQDEFDLNQSSPNRGNAFAVLQTCCNHQNSDRTVKFVRVEKTMQQIAMLCTIFRLIRGSFVMLIERVI